MEKDFNIVRRAIVESMPIGKHIEAIKTLEKIYEKMKALLMAEPIVCDCCKFQPNCRESVWMVGKNEYSDLFVTINYCSHGERKGT